MYRPDGKAFDFRLSGGVWSSDADVVDRLEQTGTGWRYTLAAGDTVEIFNTAGKLVSIADRSGRTQTLVYDLPVSSGGDGDSNTLDSVADDAGRKLAFTYDAQKRIATAIDPAGGVITYGYDSSNNLVSVTYPDGRSKTYHYNELAYTAGANLPNALTGITDENGARYATYQYSANGKAISTTHAGGADAHALAYTIDASGNPISTTVTDPLATQRTYNFTTILGVAKSTGQSQPGGSGCGPASSATTYDANGNVASRTDFNGNKTCYAYDPAHNLETARLEGLAAGKACPANIAGYIPTSGTAERVITTSWHASFRLPVSVTEPGRATTYAYDTQGNITQKSVRDTATNATRIWNWSHTYSSLTPGLVVKKIENGPRTDVNDLTTIDYHDADYACTGDPNGCRGQVSQITNALGHVTRITRHNAHGQPEEIIDPSGLVTTLAYDMRQRLISRTSGTEFTAYEYDPAGQLVRLTHPDGSSLNYEYDGAHRLVRIADSLGNAISYTLDAMGNRIREDVHDPASQLAQTRSREYDALNRLYRDFGAQGQMTSYAYDAQGNIRQVTDPLVHSTGNSYDALNRLVQINDPAGGQIRQTYDALDRVVNITDPKGVVTTYTYNGLGDLTKEVSADRGTTTYTYDSAGNLLTGTDARGVRHAYSYDALNRPISRTHATVKGVPATASLAWSYDAGANGIGRLTGMSDETGSTVFGYDAHGRLSSKTQTTTLGKDSLAHTLAYGYDASGRLTRQTYPSGAQLDLAYGIDGRPVEIRVNGQVLVSDIVYQPFGAPRAWTWGSGTRHARQFDLDGRLKQYPVGNDSRSLGFDAAGRIVSASHANPTLDRSYGYDAADRLVSEIDNLGVSLWTYDLNGNRLSAQLGASTYAYAYAAASNRLLAVAGPVAKTYAYDAAGNITHDGRTSFTYNAAGRLAEAQTKGHGKPRINAYLHNALGQRVIKDGSHLTNGHYRFIYDEQGRLVGEYDKDNQLRQETVWLSDIPLAVIKKDASGQLQVYQVHADDLNTPRAIFDSQDRLVWRWLGSAFGQNLPEEDPDGDGQAFEYNLRFPGQYYDKESNLHYNYFRDYDPSTGRYVQSDPIGLEGGMNTYGYVGGDPVSRVDPFGLVDEIYIYGYWCGPDWTGGKLSSFNLNTPHDYHPPLDQLDGCCREHDICYAQCRTSMRCETNEQASCFRNCDRKLASCSQKASGPWTFKMLIKEYMKLSNPKAEDCKCKQ